MQHKYSAADVAEMIALLQKNIFKDLSLRDFDGQPLVHLENRIQVSMASARISVIVDVSPFRLYFIESV